MSLAMVLKNILSFPIHSNIGMVQLPSWQEYPIGSGKTEFLHYQLRKGCAKTPPRCMRIYFWWDETEKMVVVGHLPGYIEKGGS